MNWHILKNILCGHTHIQGRIEHNGKKVLNAGSVGFSLHSNGKAQFMILKEMQDMVLTRAMTICKDNFGECIWPNIPEECWEQAVKEILPENNDMRDKSEAEYHKYLPDTF